ncbi:hypothetical protein ACQ4PT_033010 [Festuca glaucescens]
MSAPYDSDMGAIQAYAHDDEHAAPLQTSNGFAHTSQPQPQGGPQQRRKRGRPRRYVNPSVAMPLAIVPPGYSWGVVQQPPVMPSPLPPPPAPPSTQLVRKRSVQAQSSMATKKERKETAAGSSGVIGMNHEVITIQVGESLFLILLAKGNGRVVVLLMIASHESGKELMSIKHSLGQEGYLELLSLSCSYQPSETDGMSSSTGGLNVSLASLDGRVFGGRVAGPLTAASPVQVVVGRFQVDEEKKLNQAATSGIPGASSSTPRGALNGSSFRPGSAPN